MMGAAAVAATAAAKENVAQGALETLFYFIFYFLPFVEFCLAVWLSFLSLKCSACSVSGLLINCTTMPRFFCCVSFSLSLSLGKFVIDRAMARFARPPART